MTTTRSIPVLFICAAGTVAALCAPAAHADLTLTPEGIARGFSLTTFASGFASSGGVGPVSIDFQTDGSILVSSLIGNRIQRFANTDNQSAATAPALNYPPDEFPHGIAHFGSTIFVSRFSSQTIVELNPDGSINRTVASGLGNARDLLANPVTGRLLTSTTTGIRDVNPITGTFTTLMTDEADGISLSQDGSIVYGAIISGPRGGHLIGYSTSTGLPVFDSGFLSGGLDGTALGFGERFGYIYGNMNNGTVLEINLTTLAASVIATGGSRGDFVSADPSGSGDLLLTQSDRIIRLSGIPSPSAAAVLALGGLLASRRRRA